jgi:2-aminoethylphosphonate dioxygenase
MADIFMLVAPNKSSHTARKPGRISSEQMTRDGYLLIRSLVSLREVARLHCWTVELESAPEASGRHWVYREKSLTDPRRSLIQRIENFCPFHAEFDGFIRRGKLVRWVSFLMGGPVVLFKDKINLKLPGGGGFKAHQDQQAGWSRYAPRFVTAMVTLDPATTANGCLQVAAGRHRNGLIGEQWIPLVETSLNLEPLPTEPGDVVFFDSYLPHASGPNRTDTPRRVLYLTYNVASAGDHRAQYFADKFASFPPDIDRVPGRSYEFRV